MNEKIHTLFFAKCIFLCRCTIATTTLICLHAETSLHAQVKFNETNILLDLICNHERLAETFLEGIESFFLIILPQNSLGAQNSSSSTLCTIEHESSTRLVILALNALKYNIHH